MGLGYLGRNNIFTIKPFKSVSICRVVDVNLIATENFPCCYVQYSKTGSDKGIG
jgi:hypothetical protein